MRLLFLINGSEQSAAADRAAAFTSRLPIDWTIRTCYRPERKWKGIVPFVRAARAFRPDLVYVMDTAYTGVLAGCIAKRWIGCRLITDTGDVAYELAKSVGTYSRSELGLIRWVESLALGRSDTIVVRGSYHKELLDEQGRRSVAFIPDGVDLEQFQPGDAQDLRSRMGLERSLVVGLVGSMTWSEKHRTCYGWDIVEAMALLKGSPVKALLIGDGPGKEILARRAEELEVSSQILFAGSKPYAELPQYIRAMDVCVSTQSNDLVGMVRTTGKLPLYLACGRYVVATDVGEARRVLPGIGKLLPYTGVRDETHPPRLAQHLAELMGQREVMEVKCAARQAAKDNFDYDLLAGRLLQVCLPGDTDSQVARRLDQDQIRV
jgi:Glycosyltransferase